MRQGQKVSIRIGQFVRAFIDFVHGEPYEDKVRSLDWPMILANERELMEIVFQMAHQPENAAFLKYVDPQILTLTYYTQFVDHWTDLIKSSSNLRFSSFKSSSPSAGRPLSVEAPKVAPVIFQYVSSTRTRIYCLKGKRSNTPYTSYT